MCTALSYLGDKHYFGRTLDVPMGYGEGVVVTPRNFPLPMRWKEDIPHHYAMIGMAFVGSDFPLYYEAVNEWGLGMAGLRFQNHAYYAPASGSETEVCVFEFIPYILGLCKTVEEAKTCIAKLSLVNTPYDDVLGVAPLHWILADETDCVVIEATKAGIFVYPNPKRVMANPPQFPEHIKVLEEQGEAVPLDYSSHSRFIRAAFMNDRKDGGIPYFFRMTDALTMPPYCVYNAEGELLRTVYACCVDTKTGDYHYKSEYDPHIVTVSLRCHDLEGTALSKYPVQTT